MYDAELGAAMRKWANRQAEISKLQTWLSCVSKKLDRASTSAYEFSRRPTDLPDFGDVARYPPLLEVQQTCEAMFRLRKESRALEEKLKEAGIVFPLDKTGLL